jgi:hypothetical protein
MTRNRTRGWAVVALSLSLIGLLGCTTGSGRGSEPSWLHDLYDRDYDANTYLCAVGSGSTREKAVDTAFSTLSQVFNAKVRSETTVTSVSTASTDTMGTVSFTEDSTLLDRGTVGSATDKIVGAEVVNTYVDANATVYVRVALHRMRTAALYESEMTELDLSIARLRLKAQTEENLLVSYFALREAYDLAVRRQMLVDQLQVLDGTLRPSTLTLVERQLHDLASSISVSIEAEDDSGDGRYAPSIASEFSGILTGYGFSVVPEGTAATATLSLRYSVRPVVMENSPYRYARYELAAVLSAAGQDLLSYRKADRMAALSEGEALAKALRAACGEGALEFVQTLQRDFGTNEWK